MNKEAFLYGYLLEKQAQGRKIHGNLDLPFGEQGNPYANRGGSKALINSATLGRGMIPDYGGSGYSGELERKQTIAPIKGSGNIQKTLQSDPNYQYYKKYNRRPGPLGEISAEGKVPTPKVTQSIGKRMPYK